MNNTKAGSYGKLIAFFLVAVIVLCAFGFAVEGWQVQDITPTDKPDGNIVSGNINAPGDSNTQKPSPEPEAPKPPQYTDFITGLEASADDVSMRYLAFSIDPDAPVYGITDAQMVVEIPIENDKTRYIVFTRNSKSIGKIGSIAPTRAYMSNLVKAFDSVLVSAGTDDSASYPSSDITDTHFDLLKNSGYYYTEYSSYNYSNGELINAGLTNLGINTRPSATASTPYAFAEFFTEEIGGEMPAQSITLPYSTQAFFSYSQTNKTYVLSKNGSSKADALSDAPLEFKNVFVLFADSVTYEDEKGAETVINTKGGGKGIYMTNSTAKNITWISDASGNLSFLDENGSILTVNRGTSYIGFVKSAKLGDVKFS